MDGLIIGTVRPNQLPNFSDSYRFEKANNLRSFIEKR
nr:MAG TPA: hypothetical protein [Caudoviricetes sp.]